jgi:hypothetical protein
MGLRMENKMQRCRLKDQGREGRNVKDREDWSWEVL